MNLEEDFEDLKDNLEGLSLQEKKIKLEEFQSEVEDEILSLQTISSEVDDMHGLSNSFGSLFYLTDTIWQR